MDLCKSVKLSIGTVGTVMRNPGMLNFVPDSFKTKQLCKHVIKKLTFVKRYGPDRCKTQECVMKLF